MVGTSGLVKIVSTLLICQLIPLCIGLFLHQRRPGLAQRLKKPATRLGTLLNVVINGVILVVQFQMLRHIKMTGFVGMLLLPIAFTAAGWLLGGPGAENRRSLAISTGIRNGQVGLIIATGSSLASTPALATAAAFAIFQTIVLAVAAAAWGRLSHDETGAVQKLAT